MAIDAVIEGVRHSDERDLLILKRRNADVPAGRRQLYITKNSAYTPAPGDEVWGNAHEVVIKGHKFRRIMKLWNGSFEVL